MHKTQGLRSKKGITLIALVITIVILIILAVISINAMFGENGLITSANRAKLEHQKAETREQIELVLADAFIEKHQNKEKYNENEYLDKFVEKRLQGVRIEGNEIELNGFIFELDRSVPKLGKYIGQATEPRIKEINVTNETTNSISIEVIALRAEGGEYTYWIKKNNEGEESWKEVKGSNNTCVFNNLETNVVYNIKVRVEAKNGEAEGKTNVQTGEMPEGTIKFTEGEWQGDGTAKVTISTTEDGYTLQYQIGAIEEAGWKDIASGGEITGLTHGQTVYGRLFDGINETKDDASFIVKDEIKPIVTVTEGTITTKSIAVSVEAQDNESGMKEDLTYTYYIKKTSEGEDAYQAKATDIASNSYTFTGLTQETSYDIKVEVKGDKALNKGIGTLLSQTTKKIGGAEDGLVTGNIVASNPTWSGGKASITLSTSTTLTIQYQVGGIAEGNWKTGTSVTGLNHNDTVYARLTDGTNYGDYASVEIKDTIVPSAPTITLSGTAGTNGWHKSNVTVKITAGSDAQSGTNKVRYKVTGNQTVAQTDTSAGTTSATITISSEGTSTITAYTIDKAGNVSAAKTQVVNKDVTAPTATLTVGTKTENSIAVSVSASDATSGLATYTYYLNGVNKGTAGNSFSFTGLSAGTTYTLRVDVTDKAGNAATKTTTASTIAKTVQNTLKEGDYVTYPSSQGNLACRVLYDNSSGYGVQVITSNIIRDTYLELGSNDFTIAMNSYNNAISTLNSRAMAYNNNTYSSTGRCVGSVPNNPNQDSAGYHKTQFDSVYNGKLKDTDSNYIPDYSQMITLGIRDAGEEYWLASRSTSGGYSSFCDVRYVSDSGGLMAVTLCQIYPNVNACQGNWRAFGLRPVFILKPEVKVTGGNGTSSSPYTLGV